MDEKLRRDITEAILRRAVTENHHREMADFPSKEELEKMYALSEEHERRMAALFRRANRRTAAWRIFSVSIRAAAIFLLVVAIVFGALMANPQVREVVGDTISRWLGRPTLRVQAAYDDVGDLLAPCLQYTPDVTVPANCIYRYGYDYDCYYVEEAPGAPAYTVAEVSAVGGGSLLEDAQQSIIVHPEHEYPDVEDDGSTNQLPGIVITSPENGGSGGGTRSGSVGNDGGSGNESGGGGANNGSGNGGGDYGRPPPGNGDGNGSGSGGNSDGTDSVTGNGGAGNGSGNGGNGDGTDSGTGDGDTGSGSGGGNYGRPPPGNGDGNGSGSGGNGDGTDSGTGSGDAGNGSGNGGGYSRPPPSNGDGSGYDSGGSNGDRVVLDNNDWRAVPSIRVAKFAGVWYNCQHNVGELGQ